MNKAQSILEKYSKNLSDEGMAEVLRETETSTNNPDWSVTYVLDDGSELNIHDRNAIDVTYYEPPPSKWRTVARVNFGDDSSETLKVMFDGTTVSVESYDMPYGSRGAEPSLEQLRRFAKDILRFCEGETLA